LIKAYRPDGDLVIAHPVPIYSMAAYARILKPELFSQPPRNYRLAYDPESTDPIFQKPYQKVNFYKKRDFFISKRKLLEEILTQKDRFLVLVCSDWSRSGNLDENSKNIKELFDKRFSCVESSEFDGIFVYFYK
jgi:hypothetical protein